jgi:hypothetical protein
VPEEDVEDPVVSFAKFVKKTGKTLWWKVRKGSKAVPQENVACPAEPVLDIKSSGGEGAQAVGFGDKRGQRASWSPLTLTERGALSGREKARKSTSDLTRLS